MPETPKHPTPQQLANYGLGKLPPGELSSIHAHVAACAECRQTVENQPPDSFIGQLRGGAPRRASMLPTVPPSPSSTALPIRRSAEASPDDVPAELLGSSKFKILGKLGQGGMGAVYKAQRSFLDDVVALKVMNAAVVENPEARSRFLREMKAAGQLQHANIVRALDAEQMGDLLVLVMEFVPGIALDRLVKQRGPLEVDFACGCIVQAAMGLQHAHEKGMVHRDIKPANLMVTAKEKDVKLLDFGLVQGPSVQTGTRQTQLQTFMGTPEYVAPEQAGDARNADIRADVYSLGCTLYFLLAGQPPFKKETIVNTIMAHVEDEAQPLTEVRKDMPAGLWLVVAKMMAKKPESRFQTPLEVAQALKPFAQGEKARRPEAMPAGRSAAIDLGAPTVPPRIPPVPTPQKAKEASVGLPAATGSPAAPPRPRREKRNGKQKQPVWKIGAVLACALATIVLLGGLVLRFPRGKGPVVVVEEKEENKPAKDKPMAKDGGKESNELEERKRDYGLAMKHAEAALGKEQYADAEKGFTVALRLMPNDAEAEKGLKAATTALAAAKKIREEVDRLLAESKKAMTEKQYAVAVGLLTKGKEIAPANRSVLDALSEAQKALDADVATPLLPGKEITNSIGMKLVLIPAGKFTMGSPKNEEKRRPDEAQHAVEITKSFYVGVYTVTQGEYKKVVGSNPSWFSAEGGGKNQVKGLDASKFPVEQVNWEDAVKFCEKLSGMEKEKAAGRVYRLPTEAEWEHACRAGTKTRYYTGDAEDDLKKAGWYSANSDRRTHSVGEKKPNAFGLHDMHGNVRQWCSDWYGKAYYQNRDQRDPKGHDYGAVRVLRGGGWNGSASYCRTANRGKDPPGIRNNHIGFRVACGAARTR